MIYVELKQDGNMKKYEVKGWVLFLSFLFTLLFMVSCRTVDKTKLQVQDKSELSIFEKINVDNDVHSSVSSSEFELQRQMFSDFLSSLNIGYNGQTESDKLLFEMKRTIDGLNFQVSGTGTANYQQSESINIEELKTELLKHQDSLFKQALNGFFKEFKRSLNESKTEEKDVKVKGFQVGFYAVLTIALVAFIIGYYVSRLLRKHFP